MKISKLLAFSSLIILMTSGIGFASQIPANAELNQHWSGQHKVIFAADCQKEDKVDGKYQTK